MRYKYSAMDKEGNAVEGTLEANTPTMAHLALKEQGLFPTNIAPCCGKGCCDSGPARVSAAHDKATHPAPSCDIHFEPKEDTELADTAQLLKDLMQARTSDRALDTALKVLELAITQDALAEGPVTVQMVQEARKRVMEALCPLVTLENPSYSTGTIKEE